jgi:hypothetical protein
MIYLGKMVIQGIDNGIYCLMSVYREVVLRAEGKD